MTHGGSPKEHDKGDRQMVLTSPYSNVLKLSCLILEVVGQLEWCGLPEWNTPFPCTTTVARGTTDRSSKKLTFEILSRKKPIHYSELHTFIQSKCGVKHVCLTKQLTLPMLNTLNKKFQCLWKYQIKNHWCLSSISPTLQYLSLCQSFPFEQQSISKLKNKRDNFGNPNKDPLYEP